MILLLVGFPIASFGDVGKLKLVSEWKSIDFAFPTEKLRLDALSSRKFIPGNAVPIDVDIHYKSELNCGICWEISFTQSIFSFLKNLHRNLECS